MTRWLIVLAFAVASAAGVAVADPPAVTAKAQADTTALERKVGQLSAQRAQLAKTYAEQLEAIDKLKKQRASWRRDRELRDNLAAANDTATKLGAATGELAKANTALAGARRALSAAIDAELASKPVPARVRELERQRAQLVPATAPEKKLHRIVLPDLEVDPLADPEELEQQAAALRDSEAELDRQVVGLEKQAKDLDEVAKLRKAHERASDLARRDDDQPQRVAQSGGSKGGVLGGGAGNDSASPAPETTTGVGGGGGGAGGGPSSLQGGSSFESEASVVLSGVVDASTIDNLARAQRSGDPAQRALAAKQARDAVQSRLDQLRKKRAEIEAIVKSRTKPR